MRKHAKRNSLMQIRFLDRRCNDEAADEEEIRILK
jgi:hypothetical protein